jgi:hypothetical protein
MHALAHTPRMKKKATPSQPYFYAGEVRKTISMPPSLWKQTEARLDCYDPSLTFVDWARRVFRKELKLPPGPLQGKTQYRNDCDGAYACLRAVTTGICEL